MYPYFQSKRKCLEKSLSLLFPAALIGGGKEKKRSEEICYFNKSHCRTPVGIGAKVAEMVRLAANPVKE